MENVREGKAELKINQKNKKNNKPTQNTCANQRKQEDKNIYKIILPIVTIHSHKVNDTSVLDKFPQHVSHSKKSLLQPYWGHFGKECSLTLLTFSLHNYPNYFFNTVQKQIYISIVIISISSSLFSFSLLVSVRYCIFLLVCLFLETSYSVQGLFLALPSEISPSRRSGISGIEFWLAICQIHSILLHPQQLLFWAHFKRHLLREDH